MAQKPLVPIGTDEDYNLLCKVEVQERSFYEIADKAFHEANMVLLLPRIETTECSQFFAAYLPDVGSLCMDCHKTDLRADQIKCPHCGSERVHTEHTEVVGWIAHPVHGTSRLALLRKNNYCSQHHLFVMGTGAEQDLMGWHGKEVHVKIFSSLEDSRGDQAKSVEKSVKNRYQSV